jgi:hypothetical protein
MSRLIVTMALYAIPFAMMYASLELSRAYPAIAVFCAFLAGIVYAAIREVTQLPAAFDKGGKDE